MIKTCEICGREFVAKRAETKTCPAAECRHARAVMRGKRRHPHGQNYKTCTICGREFADAPSNSRVTCRRPECTRAAHQRAEMRHREDIIKAWEALFYESNFSHAAMGGDGIVRGGHTAFWTRYIRQCGERMPKRFPCEYLYPANIALEELVNDGDNDND